MEWAMREIAGGTGAIILIVFVLTARFRPRGAAPRRQQSNADLMAMMAEQNRILREMLQESRRAGQSDGSDLNEGEPLLLIPEWRPTPDVQARITLNLPLEGPISRSQVRQAYKKAVRAAHPDKGGSAEAFREVQKAYEFFGFSKG